MNSNRLLVIDDEPGICEFITEVAEDPKKGYHFHTGERLAQMLGYDAEDIRAAPTEALDSFAGTGNPHLLGAMPEGATGELRLVAPLPGNAPEAHPLQMMSHQRPAIQRRRGAVQPISRFAGPDQHRHERLDPVEALGDRA